MARRIDEAKLGNLKTLDLSNPPMEDFPTQNFPRMVYLHPRKSTKETPVIDPQSGLAKGVISVPTEHKTKIVANEDELQEALRIGWKAKPYINTFDQDTAIDENEYEVAEHRGPGRPRKEAVTV